MDRHLGVVNDLLVYAAGTSTDLAGRRRVAHLDLFPSEKGFRCAAAGGEYRRLSPTTIFAIDHATRFRILFR